MSGGRRTSVHRAILLGFLCAFSSSSVAAQVRLADLRTQYRVNPIGIDVTAPRMGWKLLSPRRGVVQSAYEIRVAQRPAELAKKPLWDSGRIASDASIHVAYAGPALRSGQRYYWQARVWDGQGKASAWSEPAYWEMGLLAPSDWTARWITPDLPEDSTVSNPSPMLRSEFTVNGEVASARAYVTALGLYQMELNGRPVGDELFRPGWTEYDRRLQYQTYDVTDLLRQGRNAVGVTLGDGWYRGRLAWENNRNTWGKHLALLEQIVIRYADGRRQVVGTGPDWKASTGAIRSSDIYDGELYDARLEKTGWSRPGYADADWNGVRVVDLPMDVLIAQDGPTVRRIREMKPVRIFRAPNGDTLVDMGQNMVGWVRLKVRGPRGTTVVLHHAEVLDSAGNAYFANLRTAKATDEYVLKGGGEEVFEPHFTFHGFRYVKVVGYPGELTPDDVTGIVVHSDMPQTGRFETSDSMLDRLQQNIVWGQRGNFLDVPTDTPARDERLGWTGDAQAFSATAAFNYQVIGFFTKWLGDLSADQKANGAVTDVIPDVLARHQAEGSSSSGWGDVATIVPWNLYLAYGDARLLARQYPSMRKYVEYERAQAGDDHVWSGGRHYGDWLAFATTSADYPGATTDKDLIATAFFAHSTDLLSRAAEVLGRTDDARAYRQLFEETKAAFDREFVTPNGRLASNTQTAYALALEFDLLPDGLRAEAGQRLADDVDAFGHLTTGFLGTPNLNPALTHTGHLDEAYRLLLRKEYPSWLYPITRGATTMWERWDGIKPDGSFQDVGMNSFNHYAYGAIGDWMYRTVAGIELDPAEPAYKHVVIRPRPGGGLTWVRASVNSLYGEVASAWERDGGRFELRVSVPPNTHATVWLPDARLDGVTEGGHAVATAAGVTSAVQKGDAVEVEVGSGDYDFSYPAPALADPGAP
ncbi:MAG TPA: glycoside hydrolase family 78 protein [Longimicrobiaceae bacterium]|nr:glycoside hydrolase family 78 protein [Longimicrobiaceae bacterium]